MPHAYHDAGLQKRTNRFVAVILTGESDQKTTPRPDESSPRIRQVCLPPTRATTESNSGCAMLRARARCRAGATRAACTSISASALPARADRTLARFSMLPRSRSGGTAGGAGRAGRVHRVDDSPQQVAREPCFDPNPAGAGPTIPCGPRQCASGSPRWRRSLPGGATG